MALPILEKDISHISKLADQPNDVSGGELSAADLKAEFDRAGNDIKTFLNDTLIPAIASDIEAAAEGVGGGGKIGEEKIADGAITSAKIAALAVLTSAIADLAITTAKMADGAVTEAKIKDGAVTTKKIASGAVVRDSLADESVSANKIYPGAVTSEKIAASSVGATKIADGAVTRSKLANDALYSPFVLFASGDTVSVNHIGKKLRTSSSSVDYVLNVAADSSIPNGAEIGVYWHYAKSLKLIFGSDTKVAIPGEENLLTAPIVEVNEKFDTVALEKVSTSDGYDIWHILGNVEVVS